MPELLRDRAIWLPKDTTMVSYKALLTLTDTEAVRSHSTIAVLLSILGNMVWNALPEIKCELRQKGEFYKSKSKGPHCLWI